VGAEHSAAVTSGIQTFVAANHGQRRRRVERWPIPHPAISTDPYFSPGIRLTIFRMRAGHDTNFGWVIAATSGSDSSDHLAYDSEKFRDHARVLG